jgi:hypothetical protein
MIFDIFFKAGSNVYSISKVVDSQYNKSDLNGNALKPELSLNVYEVANSFKYKQKKGNIDVWWLYEDGGLSLLIPYILKNNKLWRGCKLRIFTISHNSEDINSVRMRYSLLKQNIFSLITNCFRSYKMIILKI